MKVLAALYATAASLAVLSAPAANADYLYNDPFSYDTWDRPTYNNGDYTRLDRNDIMSSPLYDDTIQDRNGNLYDCDSIGSCYAR